MEIEEDIEADPISTINAGIESMHASKEETLELLQAARSKLEEMDGKMNMVTLAFRELTTPGESEVEYLDTNHTSNENEDLNADKLSPIACYALSDSNGPIPTSSLKSFLMEDVWGKPRPPVLPLVRTYTTDIQGTVQQILNIRDTLQEAHVNYKEQRRLDENLIRRIDRLVKNVNRELKEEAEKKKYQQPITRFMNRGCSQDDYCAAAKKISKNVSSSSMCQDMNEEMNRRMREAGNVASSSYSSRFEIPSVVHKPALIHFRGSPSRFMDSFEELKRREDEAGNLDKSSSDDDEKFPTHPYFKKPPRRQPKD